MNTGTPHQFQRAMPVLAVADMGRSLGFYRAKRGFSAATWGEPPTFAIVQRGTISLALSSVPKGKILSTGVWSAYLYVRDAAETHADFVAHGSQAADRPETRPYGCRDFTITDPDGHLIAFGQDLEDYRLGPGL